MSLQTMETHTKNYSKSIRDEQGKFNGKLTWYKIRKFLWLIGSQQRNDCELDKIPG
jgi:hypothetical protein